MNNLHYKNIILKHQKSLVESRSDCDIRQRLGDWTFECPVVMSNMKSIQNKNILNTFDKRGWFYIYHRIDGVDDIYNFVKATNEEHWNLTSISIGIQESDCDLLHRLKNDGLAVDFITIDVALSHTDSVKKVINTAKECFPDAYLICGNGNTGEWVEFMENLGVDAVKLGIGVSASCFVGDTLVTTDEGLIPISEIKIGHKVLTHMGDYKNVENLITKYSKNIYDVNGEQCTEDHKYYVIDVDDKDKINDDNIHSFAKWIKVSELDESKHFLIELY